MFILNRVSFKGFTKLTFSYAQVLLKEKHVGSD